MIDANFFCSVAIRALSWSDLSFRLVPWFQLDEHRAAVRFRGKRYDVQAAESGKMRHAGGPLQDVHHRRQDFQASRGGRGFGQLERDVDTSFVFGRDEPVALA